MGHKSAGVPDF